MVDYFSGVPDEVCLQVFVYIPLKQLHCFIPLVCKRWQRLARDESLWHSISLSELNISPDLLEKILSYHRAVKVLNMDHSEYEEKDFVRIWPLCEHLVKVSLAFCNMTQNALFVLLSACPKLRWLNLEGCQNINHIPLPTVRDQSHYLIEHLNLSHCSNFNDLGCVTIGCIFSTKLRHLNIDGAMYITDIGLGMIVDRCLADRLEFLAFDGAEITNLGIKKLQRFASLQHLQVSFCNKLTDEALDYISTLVSLKELYFKKGEHFSNLGLHHLFSCLINLKSISLLECWGTDDKCLEIISASCPQLERFAVTWAYKVTNAGVEFIAKRCRFIQALNFTGSYQITEQPLLSLLETKSNLRLLNLTQCHLVCDEMLHKFKDSIPNITIINFYNEII